MSDMLRKHATRWYGCCAACARGRNHNHKPQRLARRQARKVERREIMRAATEHAQTDFDLLSLGLVGPDVLCPVSGNPCDDCWEC